MINSYGCRGTHRQLRRRAVRSHAHANSPQSIACCIYWCSTCSTRAAAAACAGSGSDARLMHAQPKRRAAYARAHLLTSIDRVLHLGLQHLLNSYGYRDMRRQPRRRAGRSHARPLTSIVRGLHLPVQRLLNSYGRRGTHRQPTRCATVEATCGLHKRAHSPQPIVCCTCGCGTGSTRMAATASVGSRGEARCMRTREHAHFDRPRGASADAARTRLVWMPQPPPQG